MIQHDQPTIFGDTIIAAVSSIQDGTMSFALGNHDDVRADRQTFLDYVGIDPFQATLLQVTFDDTTDFARYRILEDDQLGEGMFEPLSTIKADALVVTRPDHAIFLPLADCTGAVIYDPSNRVLMVSHLGRHSVEQGGAGRSIEFLKEQFDCDPAELRIWLSPAVGAENYPLYALDNRGLHDVIIEQMVAVGADVRTIEASKVDTAENPDYFSHSEYLAGNRSEDGRFAVVAMMTE